MEGDSPHCVPARSALCWVWQPAGQLARRPITELPLISRHDRTREAGGEWEWPKSVCPWESRMERSERRREPEKAKRGRRCIEGGEKLLPAKHKVSASLLSTGTQRARFIIPLPAFNRLFPLFIYFVLNLPGCNYYI